MRGNPRRNLASVEDCINICNTVNGCKGLTFKVESKLCWLKSILFTPQTKGYKADYQYVTRSVNMDCLYGKPVKQELLSFNIFISRMFIANIVVRKINEIIKVLK